ncbi:MAG: biosynthetic-type acetolactate synthase large subunit [Verrucomicrobiales bacterium]
MRAHKSPKPKAKPAKSASERGELMTGAEVLVACLEREGVQVIFAYPGGASMPIHQALTRSKRIRTVLPRHEQGGGFAAEGYARATGRAGVCMGTSGPGATNMITAIADAFLDSTPIIAISGQVPQHMIGRGAFQETDFFGMTLPVVKHNYLVTNAQDIPRIVKEAFYIAQSGRPGPVVIDMPKDVQESKVHPVFPAEIKLRGYTPHRELDDISLNEVIGLIKQAKRPVIYAGGGIISSEAHEELLEFAERTQIPATTTIMGIGAFPETHPLSMRWLGMHGTVYANNAANEADLLLALGVRFDDRVTGKVEKFCEHGTIIHIDIDNSELNKNKLVRLPILANVKEALTRLNQWLAKAGYKRALPGKYTIYPDWIAQIDEWKRKFPMKYEDTEDLIQPQYAIEQLYKLNKDLIITTGVGQHQMWAGQWYRFDEPKRFITSAGLGSMGYGFPAAVGAKLAQPDKEVVDIDGDGSFLMNIQELATAVTENIAVKVIIINNQHLGMVVQWEDLKYNSNRAHTFLADPRHVYDPTHRDESKIYPDFVALCAGFRVKCERIIHKKDLVPALKRMLAAKEPYVLDVMVPYTEHVLPMIPGGMTYKDIITEPMGVRHAAKVGVPTAL